MAIRFKIFTRKSHEIGKSKKKLQNFAPAVKTNTTHFQSSVDISILLLLYRILHVDTRGRMSKSDLKKEMVWWFEIALLYNYFQKYFRRNPALYRNGYSQCINNNYANTLCKMV